MPVTLTGFKGGAPTPTGTVGVDALLHSYKADGGRAANNVLTALRNDLSNKTGVLRLLHTTNASKDMKFKNSGAFKQLFVSGDKLKRTGEVISNILQAAGLPRHKVDDFNQYVQRRGNNGVEAQVVLQYIDSMRAEKGATPQAALSKFGVDIGRKGKLLGHGAFGEVHAVKYRGQAFVYKQARKQNQTSLGPLTLADASRKPIVPKVPANEGDQGDGTASAKPLSSRHDDSSPPLMAPMKVVQIKENNEYMRESSSSGEASSWDKYQENNRKQQVLFSPKSSFSDESMDEDSVLGSVVDERELLAEADPPQIKKETAVDYLPLIVEENFSATKSPSQGNLGAQVPSAPVDGQQLARNGIANAARVKDLPQVLTPTLYVVKETSEQGDIQYHAVAGQWRLKDWAGVQAAGSRFDVEGVLMPRAAGNHPLEFEHVSLTEEALDAQPKQENEQEFQVELQEPSPVAPPKVHVARADLKPMAASALSLLQGLASHGFIHGDIKPANLMWDAKSKTLRLIDNDSLQKVSKRDGDIEPGFGDHTLQYMNPVAWQVGNGNQAQLGLGRDLFAIGMVLLETALGAQGRYKNAEDLISQLTFIQQPKYRAIQLMKDGLYSRGVNALNAAPFAENSVEAFARSCILESIQHEEERLKKQDFKFDRYAKVKPDHLLAKLQRQLDRVS